MPPQYLVNLIPREPFYRSPEKEKSTEMKKVALLTISPTHASVESLRPASSYAPQYLGYGVTEGNVSSL